MEIQLRGDTSETGSVHLPSSPKGHSPKGRSPKGRSPKGRSPKGHSPNGINKSAARRRREAQEAAEDAAAASQMAARSIDQHVHFKPKSQRPVYFWKRPAPVYVESIDPCAANHELTARLPVQFKFSPIRPPLVYVPSPNLDSMINAWATSLPDNGPGHARQHTGTAVSDTWGKYSNSSMMNSRNSSMPQNGIGHAQQHVNTAASKESFNSRRTYSAEVVSRHSEGQSERGRRFYDRWVPPEAQSNSNSASVGKVNALLQGALRLDFDQLSHSVRNNSTMRLGQAPVSPYSHQRAQVYHHQRAEYRESRAGAYHGGWPSVSDQTTGYTWC